MQNILDKTAIVGIGQTEFSKFSGRSELQLAAEAAKAAIDDAGLKPSDIEGMVTFTLDTNDELALQRCLGIPELRYVARGPFGGAAASATVHLAATAVASGAAKAVLIYRAFNERSGKRFGQPMVDQSGYGGFGSGPDFHVTFGLDTPAKIYALWYAHYMHRYGVTSEDLGRYSVVARANAATNPRAWFYQKPITLEDHQNSRWIVEPVLRLLDCCQESDGGVAIVVTSLDRARDLKQPPVRVAAATQSHQIGGNIMWDYYRGAKVQYREAQSTARQMFASAGITKDDIDVALIYENFTPIILMALEAHGFCGPGEAKDFIKDGHIALNGSIPVNTHGGLIGEAYIHGVNNILEGVRQIRGTAANQVKDARHVLVSASRSSMILGRA
ncbi:MAG: lipid-transfer protein [Proteobacteria bacterium]|nr:lipid-transfer protein [Pseudomonadota bacterium]HQR02825.1 lipid-transfer protein [Rhodocyclaceae bacterium]